MKFLVYEIKTLMLSIFTSKMEGKIKLRFRSLVINSLLFRIVNNQKYIVMY
jgi:hypothetical protein